MSHAVRTFQDLLERGPERLDEVVGQARDEADCVDDHARAARGQLQAPRRRVEGCEQLHDRAGKATTTATTKQKTGTNDNEFS